MTAIMSDNKFINGRYSSVEGNSIVLQVEGDEVKTEQYGSIAGLSKIIERFINDIADGSLWIFDNHFVKSLVNNNELFRRPIKTSTYDFINNDEFNDSPSPVKEWRDFQKSFDWTMND